MASYLAKDIWKSHADEGAEILIVYLVVTYIKLIFFSTAKCTLDKHILSLCAFVANSKMFTLLNQ